MNQQQPSFWIASTCFLTMIMGFTISTDAEEPLSLARLNQELRKTLKAEATSRESPDHGEHVIALCDLFAKLRGDARYPESRSLQGMCARARRRLIDVRDLIEVHLKRDGIQRPPELDINLREIDTWISESSQNAKWKAPSAKQLDKTLEGFGPGGLGDEGWMLVELITRTISPDFWDSQGGPGAAVYYPLQRALVVRATTRVHEDIQALLRALGGLP